MKIGVVSEYFDLSGSTPTVLHNLVTHIRRTHPGITFEVVASRNVYRGDETLPARETLDGVEIFRTATPKSNGLSTSGRLAAGMFFTAAALQQLIRRPKYDAILIVTNPPSLPMAARMLRRLKNTPYVYLIHDLYPDVANLLGVLPRESRISRMLHDRQRAWLHDASRIVVLGRDMKEYLVEHYHVPAELIEVIPNWADPDEVKPLPSSVFREKNDLTGCVALHSGNFGMHQDFDAILNAAKILRQKNPDVTFALAGEGQRKQQVAARIEHEHISNVRLFPLAPRSAYSDMLAAADLGLVSVAKGSEGMGVPSKFYSILASGRPTVAVVSPTSEVALVLDETEAGVHVNPGDAPALAAAIDMLARDSRKRAEMGLRARSALVDQYTIETLADRFVRVFEDVALR
jgi:glycosyltransferase involved in cell wall biosynthesis